MNVCIPIEFKAQGGGFYFLKNFETYLVQRGHRILKNIGDNYDLLFTNHWMVPRREILQAFRRNPNVRIVHRIDGAAQDYGRDPEADERQRAVNELADLTIFQSEYCRYSTREKFCVIKQDGPVIHNPVDISLFRPDGKNRRFEFRYTLAVVSWSTNPMKGVRQIYQVARENPDIGFAMCGNFSEKPNFPNLIWLGVLNRHELAEVLRSCFALVTFSQNEACPNHVLEGLSSGLPILYLDSGATGEVVGNAGLPVTADTFRREFDRVIERRDKFSAAARLRAERAFDPQAQFSKYEHAIQGALNQSPRVSLTRRKALTWLALLGL